MLWFTSVKLSIHFFWGGGMQLIHESLSMCKRKHKSVSKWYRDSKFIKGFFVVIVFGSYLLEEGRTKISSLALLFLLGWERMSALLVPCYCSVLTNSIRRRADFLWRTATCGGKTLYPSPPTNPLDNLWTTDQGHQPPWWPSEGNTGLLNSRRKGGVGEWAAVSRLSSALRTLLRCPTLSVHTLSHCLRSADKPWEEEKILSDPTWNVPRV